MSACRHEEAGWCDAFVFLLKVVLTKRCSRCLAIGIHSIGPSNDDYSQHDAEMAMARAIASQERVAKTMRGRSR